MNIKNLHEKNFSSFGKTVFYNITQSKIEGKNNFGIQVITKSANYSEEEMIEDISPNENFVKEIVDYLYENAVDTTHFKDVTEDYMLKMEDV